MSLKSVSIRPRHVILGFALGVVGIAVAGAQRPPQRFVLQNLDSDHDGKLSPQEIQAAPSLLRTLDRNGDGQLTPDELEPPRPEAGADTEQLVTQLMSFDRNGDGELTPDELPERMRSIFERGIEIRMKSLLQTKLGRWQHITEPRMAGLGALDLPRT